MNIEIEDLKKVRIDPGDILIVKCKIPLRKDRIDCFKKVFPENKILFLDSNNNELILAQMHREFDEVKTL